MTVAGLTPPMIAPMEADPEERRRRGLHHGRRMLALLDDLRIAALGQGDARLLLERLQSELTAEEKTDDARLAAILDQVRVRGEVEIAKAETARINKARSA